MNEADFMKKMLLESNDADCVLYRNNTGVGWAGKFMGHDGAGNTILKNARPLHAGLCTGSSDAIGWADVIVSPEMVGRSLAVFLAVEAKSRRGATSADQIRFLHNVNRAGGIGIVLRDGESIVERIADARSGLLKHNEAGDG